MTHPVTVTDSAGAIRRSCPVAADPNTAVVSAIAAAVITPDGKAHFMRFLLRALRYGCRFAPSLDEISSRRPFDVGGAGIVISSTPSRKVAFASSVIAPWGRGIVR